MPDEMCAALEQCCHVLRVALEVHPPVERGLTEAAPVDQEQAIVRRQRTLFTPRVRAATEAAMYEHGARPIAEHGDVDAGRCLHERRLRRRRDPVRRGGLEEPGLPAKRIKERVDNNGRELRAATAPHFGCRLLDRERGTVWPVG